MIILKDGILVINKEKGMTSRDVCNQVGKILHTKKVGHTGTLDPLAEGVLVLGVNQGTKIIELLTSTSKEYIAEVVVGEDSDTLDVTGVIQEVPLLKTYTKEEIRECLNSFIGTYEQEVPLYSAVHVNGERLYEYARSKRDVKLPSRMVTISEIEFLSLSWEEGHQIFSFRVAVSKGTYIRSLIRDIGKKLGTCCIMKNLKRTRQGNFTLEDTIKISDLKEDASLLKIEDALLEYDKVVVSREMEEKIRNGALLPRNMEKDYVVFLSEEKKLLAIYQPYPKNLSLMKPWKVFCGGENHEKVK